MLITITLGELLAARQSLEFLSSQKLPFSVAWDLRQNIKPIKAVLTDYENLVNEFIKDNGVPDQHGIPSINRDQNPQQYKEFIEMEHELRAKVLELNITPVRLSTLLERAPELEMSIADIEQISFIFDEEVLQ